MSIEEIIKLMKEKREELVSRSKESKDVNELRSINTEIDNLNNYIKELEANVKDEEKRTFEPMGTYGMRAAADEKNEDMEYRIAFMNHVLKGTPIERRANANTLTTDAEAAIPTTLVDRIVEKMESCGMILPLVTKTSFQGGVVVPTSTVKPVASWVGEGATSDKQKKALGKIVFSFYKLRCEISMSMEVGTMAISTFEQRFVEQVSKAMTIALEKAIIGGTGTGQPTGILNGTITNAQKITMKGGFTYKDLCDIEALVPVEYEGTAKWCMTKGAFMQIMGCTDSNGQPIARVNYGIGGKVERTILGRDVIIHPYKEAMGSHAAFIFDFSDYILNTVYDMGISKKQDWDTEDLLTKAVMSVDGKPVSIDSLVVVDAVPNNTRGDSK